MFLLRSQTEGKRRNHSNKIIFDDTQNSQNEQNVRVLKSKSLESGRISHMCTFFIKSELFNRKGKKDKEWIGILSARQTLSNLLSKATQCTPCLVIAVFHSAAGRFDFPASGWKLLVCSVYNQQLIIIKNVHISGSDLRIAFVLILLSQNRTSTCGPSSLCFDSFYFPQGVRSKAERSKHAMNSLAIEDLALRHAGSLFRNSALCPLSGMVSKKRSASRWTHNGLHESLSTTFMCT